MGDDGSGPVCIYSGLPTRLAGYRRIVINKQEQINRKPVKFRRKERNRPGKSR